MIAWFARNGVAANIVMLAVMIAGAWTLWQDKIPLEVFQDVPSRFISINVPYPASSPAKDARHLVVAATAFSITFCRHEARPIP
jgi:multidrug efflux pump subunit AcrB